jgi:hypothetical protein
MRRDDGRMGGLILRRATNFRGFKRHGPRGEATEFRKSKLYGSSKRDSQPASVACIRGERQPGHRTNDCPDVAAPRVTATSETQVVASYRLYLIQLITIGRHKPFP